MNILSLIYFSYGCDKKKSSHKSNLREIKKKPKGLFWLIVWGPAHVGREVLSVGAIGGWSHWNYSQEVGSNDCHVLFFIQSKIQVLGMYHSLLVCVFNPNNLIKIIIHRYKIIIHRDLILGPPQVDNQHKLPWSSSLDFWIPWRFCVLCHNLNQIVQSWPL